MKHDLNDFLDVLKVIALGRRELNENAVKWQIDKDEALKGLFRTFDIPSEPDIIAATDPSLLDSGDEARIAEATANAWLCYCDLLRD